MASVAEPAAAYSARRRSRRRSSIWRTSLGYGRTRLGLALTAGVILLALFGPLFAPHAKTAFVGPPYQAPSSAAPLGTDYLGHDVLSQVLYGGQSLVWMVFASVTLGVVVGVVLGMIAGYSRGVTDGAIMRLLDVLLAFPQIVFVLLFVAMLGHSLLLIVVLVAIANAPGVARVARGVTADIAERDFVLAAGLIGIPRWRVLSREVLPNIATPLLVEYTLRLTWAIATIAALSFLGYGVQPPNTDWGLMVNQNRGGLVVQPWATIVPIVLIAIFAIGTNLVGEGFAWAVAGIDREAPEP